MAIQTVTHEFMGVTLEGYVLDDTAPYTVIPKKFLTKADQEVIEANRFTTGVDTVLPNGKKLGDFYKGLEVDALAHIMSIKADGKIISETAEAVPVADTLNVPDVGEIGGFEKAHFTLVLLDGEGWPDDGTDHAGSFEVKGTLTVAPFTEVVIGKFDAADLLIGAKLNGQTISTLDQYSGIVVTPTGVTGPTSYTLMVTREKDAA